MNKTFDEVAEDCKGLYYGDRTIHHHQVRIYEECKAKGLPYHELLSSKFMGTIKYLFKRDPENGVSLTDLDTGETYWKY